MSDKTWEPAPKQRKRNLFIFGTWIPFCLLSLGLLSLVPEEQFQVATALFAIVVPLAILPILFVGMILGYISGPRSWFGIRENSSE